MGTWNIWNGSRRLGENIHKL